MAFFVPLIAGAIELGEIIGSAVEIGAIAAEAAETAALATEAAELTGSALLAGEETATAGGSLFGNLGTAAEIAEPGFGGSINFIDGLGSYGEFLGEDSILFDLEAEAAVQEFANIGETFVQQFPGIGSIGSVGLETEFITSVESGLFDIFEEVGGVAKDAVSGIITGAVSNFASSLSKNSEEKPKKFTGPQIR